MIVVAVPKPSGAGIRAPTSCWAVARSGTGSPPVGLAQFGCESTGCPVLVAAVGVVVEEEPVAVEVAPPSATPAPHPAAVAAAHRLAIQNRLVSGLFMMYSQVP